MKPLLVSAYPLPAKKRRKIRENSRSISEFLISQLLSSHTILQVFPNQIIEQWKFEPRSFAAIMSTVLCNTEFTSYLSRTWLAIGLLAALVFPGTTRHTALAEPGISHAVDAFTPPYGLRWGDPPSKLIDWAEREDLDARIELPASDRRIQRVMIRAQEGDLPGEKVSEIEASFLEGRLFEVALHYAPALAADRVKAAFLTTRRQLGRQWGELRLNWEDRDDSEKFRRSSSSYHTEPSPGLLLIMIHSEISDLLRNETRATFSIIYRNQNLWGSGEAPPLPGPQATP